MDSQSEEEFFDAVEHSASTDQLAKALGRRLALETILRQKTCEPEPPAAGKTRERPLENPSSGSSSNLTVPLINPGSSTDAAVILEVLVSVATSPEFTNAINRLSEELSITINVEKLPVLHSLGKPGLPRARSHPQLSQFAGDDEVELEHRSAVSVVDVTIEGETGNVTKARCELLRLAQKVHSGRQSLLTTQLQPSKRGGKGRGLARRTPGQLQIFVDNSNIYFGAWNSRGEAGAQDRSVRVDVGRLVEEIERGRDIGVRKVVGASPDASDPMWEEWRMRGYDTRIGIRTAQQTEQFVDDALHSEILRGLLQHQKPQTLVLLSGDGNQNNGGTSFPWCCEEALKRGWHVEVYAWGTSMSQEYRRLKSQYQSKMHVVYLDTIKYFVTFRQPRGVYIPGVATPKLQRRQVDRSMRNLMSNYDNEKDGLNPDLGPKRRTASTPSLAESEAPAPTPPKKKKDPVVPPCWRGVRCADESCKGSHPNGRAIDVPDYIPPDEPVSTGNETTESAVLAKPTSQDDSKFPSMSREGRLLVEDSSLRYRSHSADRFGRSQAYARCLKSLSSGDSVDVIIKQMESGGIADINELVYISDINKEVTVLMLAAKYGRRHAARYMLGVCEADVNCGDREGVTALMYAAANGHHAMVDMLLEFNARGRTSAAHAAKAAGHMDLAEKLNKDGSKEEIRPSGPRGRGRGQGTSSPRMSPRFQRFPSDQNNRLVGPNSDLGLSH